MNCQSDLRRQIVDMRLYRIIFFFNSNQRTASAILAECHVQILSKLARLPSANLGKLSSVDEFFPVEKTGNVTYKS